MKLVAAPFVPASTSASVAIIVPAAVLSGMPAVPNVPSYAAAVVVGTHTHVPTGDAHILTGGTAYQTDIGMCGDYDSVIGMKKQTSVERFVRKMPTARLEAADGEATLCATFVETDDDTGLARRVEPLRLGGILSPTMPE